MAPHITPMTSFRAMLIVSCAHTMIAYKTNDNPASQAIRQIKVHIYLYLCTSGEVHEFHDAWSNGESESCCSG